MEGCHKIRQVLQSVMYYLTQTFDCEAKFSPSLYAVEQITDEDEYYL